MTLVTLKPELVDGIAKRAAETNWMKWIFAISKSGNLQRLGEPLRQWRERGIRRVANARRKAIDHHRLFHRVVLEQRQMQRIGAGRLCRLFLAAREQLVDCTIDVAINGGEKCVGELTVID